LAELIIPDIERRTGVKFDYVPVLLGGIYKLTNNRSPAEYLAGIKTSPNSWKLETQRFIRRHNIKTFRKNPFFPVNTLQLMRGAVAAQFEGILEPYFRAAYHHMWEEPKKMDDPQVAREAFTSSNIDFDRLFARAQQQDVKDRLLKLTQDAVDRGAFGSPTFFVGKECSSAKTSCATSRRQSSRHTRRQAGRPAGARLGSGICDHKAKRKTLWQNLLDTTPAADILAGLPNRIHEVIATHVAEKPKHPAFIEAGRVWTYRAFTDAVEAVAADLTRLQIRPGDRVLLASENSVALSAFVFACSKLEAWPVVVNPRLSLREIDQINVHSGAGGFLSSLVSPKKRRSMHRA